jgi:hypothetical protein
VSVVKFTFSEIVDSAGMGVAIPKVPCSLKLLIPKLTLFLEVEMPKAGMLATGQFPEPSVPVKSGLLETTCQRSRQLMGGETGVGVPVSVGVRAMVSVNGIAVSVAVGGNVGVTSIVAVIGIAVCVGSGF